MFETQAPALVFEADMVFNPVKNPCPLRLKVLRLKMKRLPSALFIPSSAIVLVWSFLPACSSEEICDWKDNDNDGIIDEGFDVDGDGWWACGLTQALQEEGLYDCDDTNSAVHPDAVEICNEYDDDCSGLEDEGCAETILKLPIPVVNMTEVDTNQDGLVDVVFAGELKTGPWNSYTSMLMVGLADSTGGLFPLDSNELVSGNDILALSSFDINGDSGMDLITAQRSWILGYIQDDSGGYSMGTELLYSGYEDTIGFYELLFGASAFELDENKQAKRIHLSGVWDNWGEDFYTPNLYSYIFEIEGTDIVLREESMWQAEPSTILALHLNDLNNDSVKDELIVAGSSILWRLGIDNTWATSQQNTVILEDLPSGSAMVDVDTDGYVDIVYTLPRRMGVYWHRNNRGTIEVEAREIDQPFRHPELITPLDMNFDGIPDLAISSRDDAELALLLGDGQGGYALGCIQSTLYGIRSLLPWPASTQSSQGVLVGHEGGEVIFVEGECP